MTPITKIPTIAVIGTPAPVIIVRRNLSRLHLYASGVADVAQMRPLEPLPAPAFTVPCRPYSEALRGVGGQVVRVVQPYK